MPFTGASLSCSAAAHWPGAPALLLAAVMFPSADSDIVYTTKPVWETYLRLIEISGADAAFQKEEPGEWGSRGARCSMLGTTQHTCPPRGGIPLQPRPSSAAKSCVLVMRPHMTRALCFALLSTHPCHAVNGGNDVMQPTPAAISLTEKWAGYAVTAIKEGQHDQSYMKKNTVGRISATVVTQGRAKAPGQR